MKDSKIVLENKLGQVVRTFDCAHSQVVVVKRLDTGRIELHKSKAELDRQGIRYEEITRASKSALKTHSIEVGNYGRLKLLSKINEVTPQVNLPEENDNRRKSIFAWTAAGHIVVLALIFVLGYFLKPDQPIAPQVVKIVIQKPKPKMKKKLLK